MTRSSQFASATVGEYMTASPVTIARHRSLSSARKEMLDHKVRHLPVLEGGHVVGVLTERDLLLVESLPGANPTEVRVEDAMVQDVYAVGPETPLVEVVRQMEQRRLGSAVIVEGDHPVGVFTTTDALRVLGEFLVAL
jgi:acetoin utilization protein AcuB